VGISVAVLGIQWHIHRMGITLHLGGSMSLEPHVRPPLDALIFGFTPVLQRKTEHKPEDIAKSWYAFYNPLDSPSLHHRG
jgi:hypothetical protein